MTSYALAVSQWSLRTPIFCLSLKFWTGRGECSLLINFTPVVLCILGFESSLSNCNAYLGLRTTPVDCFAVFSMKRVSLWA